MMRKRRRAVMIESIENALQIAVLCFCLSLTAYRAIRFDRKAWTVLFFFFVSRFLGDIYYQVCLLYFGETPEVAFVSDVSWVASYLFLILLMKMSPVAARITESGSQGLFRKYFPWIGFIFAFAMEILYNQWSNPVTNTAYAILTGWILFEVIRGMLCGRCGWVYPIAFIFILFEYGTWTVSCFSGDIFDYAYYGFDTLMTISFPFFIPIVQKELISETVVEK